MKPTQEELATTLYDSLLTYEDAFAILDGKVRTVFNRQVGTIEALNKQVEKMQKEINALRQERETLEGQLQHYRGYQ